MSFKSQNVRILDKRVQIVFIFKFRWSSEKDVPHKMRMGEKLVLLFLELQHPAGHRINERRVFCICDHSRVCDLHSLDP